jgi:hypothetical protein
MKSRKISVISAAILALLVISAGCTWVSNENLSLKLMNKVPQEATSFVFWDINALRANADLMEVYDDWTGREGEELGKFGIEYPTVTYFARVRVEETEVETVKIFEGDFALADIRDKLKNPDGLNYTRQPRAEDVEMWTDSNGEGEAVALIKGAVFIGNEGIVDDCIKIYMNEKNSLQDDQYTGQITDRLPDGIMVMIIKDGESPQYHRLLASGTVYRIRDKDTLEVRAVHMFDGEGSAEEILNEVRASWNGERYYYSPETNQKGEFIESKALMRSMNLSYF